MKKNIVNKLTSTVVRTVRKVRPKKVKKGFKPRGGIGRMIDSFQPNSSNRRSQVIIEDEFVVDINGSVGFVNTQLQVNPGIATTFPWGSRPSGNYSEYMFEMLEFYYTPEVTGFATQGQTGKVILSFDYDATATALTTKQQAEAMATQGRTKNALKGGGLPCEYQWMPVDCNQIHKGDSKYVLPGAQPASTDLKTYNAGILNVSTIGQANTTLIGELHVKYRCRLEKPILDPAVVAGGVVHFSSIAATTANNFASNVQQAGGSPGLTGITLGTNTVVFPAGIPGNYLVLISVMGATSASAMSNNALSAGSGLGLYTVSAVRDAGTNIASLAGTTTNFAFLQNALIIPVAGATLTINPSTIVGTGSSDVFIVSLPVSILTVSAEEKRIERLEEIVRRMSADDWQCHSYDQRKPEIPIRTIDFDEKSQRSVSKAGQWFAGK